MLLPNTELKQKNIKDLVTFYKRCLTIGSAFYIDKKKKEKVILMGIIELKRIISEKTAEFKRYVEQITAEKRNY